MGKQYYLPRKDETLLTWHNTYTAAMALHGASLGFSAAEIAATKADNALLHAKWGSHQAAKTAAQSELGEEALQLVLE